MIDAQHTTTPSGGGNKRAYGDAINEIALEYSKFHEFYQKMVQVVNSGGVLDKEQMDALLSDMNASYSKALESDTSVGEIQENIIKYEDLAKLMGSNKYEDLANKYDVKYEDLVKLMGSKISDVNL